MLMAENASKLTNDLISCSYQIKSEFDHMAIRQEVIDPHGVVTRRVLYLQEQGIRDALIALGWTPPKAERNQLSNAGVNHD